MLLNFIRGRDTFLLFYGKGWGSYLCQKRGIKFMFQQSPLYYFPLVLIVFLQWSVFRQVQLSIYDVIVVQKSKSNASAQVHDARCGRGWRFEPIRKQKVVHRNILHCTKRRQNKLRIDQWRLLFYANFQITMLPISLFGIVKYQDSRLVSA